MRNSIILLTAVLCGCASVVERSGAPAWTTLPTRSVENGHLVFVGKSETRAVDDLANECTFVPKGARIEERYEGFVKVGVSWDECESARKAIDPDTIRVMASSELTASAPEESDAPVGFVEYHPDEGAVEVEASPPPIADDTGWFAARQQIAAAKREIIVAPPESFAPGSEERDRFLRAIEPAEGRVIFYAVSNPRVVTTTWSSLPKRPRPLPPLGAPIYRPAPQPPTIVDETPSDDRKPAAQTPRRHTRPRRQKR